MPLNIEVVLSPALYPYRTTTGRHITVVIDVLRFTTSLISAFDNGVKAVIPVSSLAEAEDLKKQGYPVAAERDGLRLSFADYGNSASDFRTPEITGKTLVYSTTNGTVAMTMAAENGPVIAAAFTNLPAVAEWLNKLDEHVVILCSGWKNLFSTEDTLCAGALVEMLIANEKFTSNCDAGVMALRLWQDAKTNLKNAVMQTSHYQRLLGLGVEPMPDYTINTGISESLPVFANGLITDQRNTW
jgi:2-phosphosulfolactate phosphatase